ncbi:TetR/AcrR family transcriptional regulator [Patescibacteria group bacterium]|nr:TetR/AcrR family transcriptional regulator [Patescibacteria group bacterium]
MEKVDTSIGILTAARDLFSQKGYNTTTTKEIAKMAGVNEVTIFRKFQSKQKLFEAVYEHFNYNQNINIDINDYENQPKQFLMHLGKSLYNLFYSNLSLIQIELRNKAMLNESILPIHKFPKKLKGLISSYFVSNNLMSEDEAELFSVNFICSIFGLFVSINILHTFDPAPDFEKCLKTLVDSLVV